MSEQAIRDLLVAGRLEQAETLARAVVAADPSQLVIWSLLAQALRAQGSYAETLEIQETLVEVRPGDLSARFDLAETALLLGDFERGWREYRHRYSLPHTVAMSRQVQRPRWGGEPLTGKTLLVHDEQGYGDIFQFLRLLPMIKARTDGRVILEIHPDLAPFARRLTSVDQVIVKGEAPPPFDVFCELMSLPMAMGLRVDDLPGAIPYLHTPQARIDVWRGRLAGLPRPLVALVWSGSPTHRNDANRSLRLDQLAPLGPANAGGTFVALQKGPAAAQALAPPAGMRLQVLGDQIRDFEDTAAILEIVDLLITVDSSPAHLAGALGRPAWVLLPLVPDWRWQTKRDDSPWYPSLRLLRQKRRGDWSEVIERVAASLKILEP